MKGKLLVIGLVLAILLGVRFKDRAEAHTSVSLSVFFDALSPYGNWISIPDYGGYVWHPFGIGPDWRPYTSGRWLWSDYGWLWFSYEPWGWATYHYGRWVFDDYYGWIWIPGTVWAPAWVTWYIGPDYIGWAPLPPDDGFFIGIGIGFSNHHHRYINPAHCVFVPSDRFLDYRVGSVAFSPSRNITIINKTRNVTNIRLVDNRIVNYGPDVGFVEKSTKERIKKVNVVDSDLTVIKKGKRLNELDGNTYRAFRPRVFKEKDGTRNKWIIKEKEPVETKGGSELVIPGYKKTLRDGWGFQNRNGLDKSNSKDLRIDSNDEKKGLIQIRKDENRFPRNRGSFNRVYSTETDNKGDSFIGGNETPTQSHDYGGGYTVQKGVKRQDALGDGEPVRPKKAKRDSYSFPRFKEADYKGGSDKGETKAYLRAPAFSQKKGWNPGSYKNSDQGFTNYQNSRRKGLRDTRQLKNQYEF
jgi:hypothetical protein